jgi:hypothetical protein
VKCEAKLNCWLNSYKKIFSDKLFSNLDLFEKFKILESIMWILIFFIFTLISEQSFAAEEVMQVESAEEFAQSLVCINGDYPGVLGLTDSKRREVRVFLLIFHQNQFSCDDVLGEVFCFLFEKNHWDFFLDFSREAMFFELLSKEAQIIPKSLEYWDDRKSWDELMRFSCQRDYLACCRVLVAAGGKINLLRTKDDDFSLLAIACSHGFNDVIRFLLDKGADVNDRESRLPLILSVKQENEDVVGCLLEAGAKPGDFYSIGTEERNVFDIVETAFQDSRQNPKHPITRLLVSAWKCGHLWREQFKLNKRDVYESRKGKIERSIATSNILSPLFDADGCIISTF